MGCSGACCAAFPLSSSRAKLWIDQDVPDGLDILAMIVPLTLDELVERAQRFGIAGEPCDPEREHFRCVHWDEQTRLCGNYANRPEMCRAYPYGKPCEHGCDADWDHAPRVWEGDYG
jgi:Fe-S-cluster containining protein